MSFLPNAPRFDTRSWRSTIPSPFHTFSSSRYLIYTSPMPSTPLASLFPGSLSPHAPVPCSPAFFNPSPVADSAYLATCTLCLLSFVSFTGCYFICDTLLRTSQHRALLSPPLTPSYLTSTLYRLYLLHLTPCPSSPLHPLVRDFDFLIFGLLNLSHGHFRFECSQRLSLASPDTYTYASRNGSVIRGSRSYTLGIRPVGI